jgi:phosphotransferase system enzyme I (PtsI)
LTSRSDGTRPRVARRPARARRPGKARARAARILVGLPAAPGVAIGRALVLERGAVQVYKRALGADEVDAEVQRLEAAVARSRQQIVEVREKLRQSAGDEYAFMFDAHLLFLEDRRLVGDALDGIRKGRVNAEWALSRAAAAVEKTFAEIDDPYLRDRVADVSDVHDRIQRNLAGSTGHLDLDALAEDVIIIAHALPPSEAASLHHARVVGFVTEVGGRTSHTAIVAKSLEIPAVVGVKEALATIQPGSLIAVDGRQGKVLVSPNEAAVRRYVRRRKAYLTREQRLIANRDLPALTRDGVRVRLLANIELLDELESAAEHGAEGIGLYRSEFLFLMKTPQLPTEEEHYETYKRLIASSAPQPVTIRTLDLGGEKYFHDVLSPGEANPILGLRAIRFCLTRPDIIETQLKAILRAAVHGATRVMFPLITCMEELDTIRAMLERVQAMLREEGRRFDASIPVGIMVEVPSAALIADLMARRVDFFAIGTNDLIQYTLAVDRGNEHVSHLFQPLHPAVLRLLQHTARSARDAGIGLSLCGEMAAHPLHACVLLGLGIEELSMDPVSIPVVKEAIRSVGAKEMHALVADMLRLDSAPQIEEMVSERLTPLLGDLSAVAGRERARPRRG